MNLQDTIRDFEYHFTINEMKSMNKLKHKKNLKLTYNSLLYIDMIYFTEKCTISYIAKTLDIAKSSVTLKVKELEKMGLIEKRQDQEDKRVYILHVTGKGSEIREIYDHATTHSIEEIESRYSKDEIECFCKILETFFNHYYEDLKLRLSKDE